MCVWCLTCNDGGGLASHLVFVNILSIVQFPLHQDSGPEENYEKIKLLRKSEENNLLAPFLYSLNPSCHRAAHSTFRIGLNRDLTSTSVLFLFHAFR